MTAATEGIANERQCEVDGNGPGHRQPDIHHRPTRLPSPLRQAGEMPDVRRNYASVVWPASERARPAGGQGS
jgi:hypothetical protein